MREKSSNVLKDGEAALIEIYQFKQSLDSDSYSRYFLEFLTFHPPPMSPYRWISGSVGT